MCELTIQERALNHNIRLVRREAGNAKLIGVVKGNGYGLGPAAWWTAVCTCWR